MTCEKVNKTWSANFLEMKKESGKKNDTKSDGWIGKVCKL